MHIEFLGGAQEVGGSSTLIEFGSTRILVDCGIRMHGTERLPDLARLQDGNKLDAIILTHAHMDHSGALPVIAKVFPTTPLYMTPPTFELIQILLSDAINIMKNQWDVEREIPLYSENMVKRMLESVLPIPFNHPILIGEECRAAFFPAGHIAGAACVGLQTIEGNVLVTGDISIDDQQTVAGMSAPKFKPHVVICESTYGGRLHASREMEEKRLVERVTQTIEQQGKVLIPAFAVGRAQEIILILQRAMRRKDIPEFPVFVDGMVRNICATYTRFPFYLKTKLRAEINKWGEPFFGILDNIKRVLLPKEREEILKGPPCCIISSSGMLTGGPSLFYALALMHNEKNLIAITGYQDEESPGRKLLDLAEGRSSSINVGDQEYSVNCAITKYALSAHADSNQISALMWRIKPREIVLVHGDKDARAELAFALKDEHHGGISLPDNGDRLSFQLRRSVASIKPVQALPEGISEDQPLSVEGLARIAEIFLTREDAKKRTYTIQEILEVWYGPGNLTPERINHGLELIEKARFFKPDRRRPFMYKLDSPEQPTQSAQQTYSHQWEQNAILNKIKKVFPPESGLYKCGALLEENAIQLSFHFPSIAAATYAGLISELEKESGWKITVNPELHHGMLNSLATELVSKVSEIVKNPSIHRELQEVHISVANLPPQETIESLQQTFSSRTGYSLILKQQAKLSVKPREAFDQDGRMEINLTFSEIDRAFSDQVHKPYRKSRKTDATGMYIELSFISKAIAERYLPIIEQLQTQTGWEIKINPQANLNQILEIARELVGTSLGIKKGPSYFGAKSEVQIKTLKSPTPEQRLTIQNQFIERTGLQLIFL